MEKYEKEFKLMIVGLLESGQPSKTVSQDYGLNVSVINCWRREYHSERKSFTGKGKASLSDSEKELQALRKDLSEVKLERDILKKAVHIFSRGD